MKKTPRKKPGPAAVLDDEFSRELRKAIYFREYPAFYRLLRQRKNRFCKNDASMLCGLAIEANLTPKAFRALLALCPSVPQINDLHPYNLFCLAQRSMGGFKAQSLVTLAVKRNCSRLLEVLLEEGADPNDHSPREWAPLEIAVNEGYMPCMKVLLRHPDLDLTITTLLLLHWAECGAGDQYWSRPALQMLAKKLPPELFFRRRSRGLPIPRALDLEYAIRYRNPWLFLWLLREGDRPDKNQAKRMLAALPLEENWPDPEDEDEFASELNADRYPPRRDPRVRALCRILRQYPGLLAEQSAVNRVVSYYLALPAGHRGQLEPWIGRLKGKVVPVAKVITEDAYGENEYGISAELFTRVTGRGTLLALRRWEALLPDGPRPGFDANQPFKDDGEQFLVMPELLERILAQCVILRGITGPKPVSRLARLLLTYGSRQQILRQLRPGGLLADEDPLALREYLAGPDAPDLPEEDLALFSALAGGPGLEEYRLP